MRNGLERNLSIWAQPYKETAREGQARGDNEARAVVGVEMLRRRWLREISKR